VDAEPSPVNHFGERVNRSWERAQTAAPIPHAELLSLKNLCAQAKVPYEVIDILTGVRP